MADGVLSQGYRVGRKAAIALVGTTVVLLGVVMVVLPGPALLVIPLGLGILAVEFAWARRWLDRLKERTARLAARLGRRGDVH